MMMKRILVISLIVMLAMLASCSNDNKSPESTNGGSPQTPVRPPVDQSAAAFTITQSQFEAEKALLAGYSALRDGDSVQESGGKYVFSRDVTSGDVIIKAGSYYTGLMPSSGARSASARAADATSIEVDMKVAPVDRPSDVMSISFKGSADADMSNLKTDSFVVIDSSNEQTSFDSTPGIFLATAYDSTLRSIISSFVQSNSVLDCKVDEDASYYDLQKKMGWVVFRSQVIDDSWHKLNFTLASDGSISEYTLDGWCEKSSSGEVAVAENPAVKGDNGPITDDEAVELASTLFGYMQYLGNMTTGGVPSLPSGMTLGNNGVISFTGYVEPLFFGRPVSITGSFGPTEYSNKVFCFDMDSFDGIEDIYIEIGSDGSGTTTGGACYAFTVGGANYMHLKDETYLAMIRIFTLSSYIPSIFEDINKDALGKSFTGVTQENGKYIFTDAKPTDGIGFDGEPENPFRFTLNGSIEISGSSFTIRNFSIAEEGAKTIEFTADGTLSNGKPNYSSADFSSHGGRCEDYEIDYVNRIVPHFVGSSF